MMIYKQIHHIMNDYDFSKRIKVNFYGMLTHKTKMTTNSITQRNYEYCIAKFWHIKLVFWHIKLVILNMSFAPGLSLIFLIIQSADFFLT